MNLANWFGVRQIWYASPHNIFYAIFIQFVLHNGNRDITPRIFQACIENILTLV